jgi:hypothetical protein
VVEKCASSVSPLATKVLNPAMSPWRITPPIRGAAGVRLERFEQAG